MSHKQDKERPGSKGVEAAEIVRNIKKIAWSVKTKQRLDQHCESNASTNNMLSLALFLTAKQKLSLLRHHVLSCVIYSPFSRSHFLTRHPHVGLTPVILFPSLRKHWRAQNIYPAILTGQIQPISCQAGCCYSIIMKACLHLQPTSP